MDEILPTTVAEIVQPAPGAVETTTPTLSREHAPKPSKRNSLFGSLFNKVSSPSQEKSEREVGPIVPVTQSETAPVSAVAPQLTDPVDTTASRPIAMSNEAGPVTPGTTNTRHTLTSSSPPKGGIFAFMKGKDARSEVSYLIVGSLVISRLYLIGEEGGQSRGQGRRAQPRDRNPECSRQRCARSAHDHGRKSRDPSSGRDWHRKPHHS